MYLMLQRELSHLNGRKLHQRQVQVSYILYVRFHLVLYREHVHSHDFYDFCVLPEQGQRVRVRVNLRLMVNRPSVRLGNKHLETHHQQFFSNSTPAVIVLM
jgi:hypothetical protein